MLRLHRRHLKSCEHRSLSYRRCKCPVWVMGSLNGKRIRKALDTTSWEKGEEILRALDPEEAPEKITIETACDRFLEDCKWRRLATETVGKYDLLARQLKERFKGVDIRNVNTDDLSKYRETWKVSPISARKKTERLKAFFKFCVDRGWRRGNPALSLKYPVARPKPTLPFSDAEIEKMLWATEVYSTRGYGESNRLRIRAFVNLLRFTGLRIRDAVTLEQEKIADGKLLIYTQKTGQPVYLPLPSSLLDELGKVSPGGTSAKYFFWTGNGLPKSAVADWQRSLSKLFKLAGVKNGYAHRFRDTFSVNLLQKGVPLETVSILLGHSNSRITAKHYNPWVKSRQAALEAEIQKAWKLS